MMLKENERSKFLYETKKLLPCQRKEMAIDFISKAKDLLGQELILDDLYNQMDYKTMGNLTRDKYKQAIKSLEFALDRFN